MASSNLPPQSDTLDSATAVRSFFDNYYTASISFPVEQVDAVVAFFEKRGFDTLAANSTSVVLLQQAKLDNVNVFSLLDTLNGMTDVQLSAVVAEVLNYNRQKNSVLGYTQQNNTSFFEARNIRA